MADGGATEKAKNRLLAELSVMTGPTGAIGTTWAGTGTGWDRGGMVGPVEAAAVEVEGETVGIRGLRKLLGEEQTDLDNDDAELTRLQEQTRRVRDRRKWTLTRIEDLEKEIELLEAYARMRAAEDV